jgi:predicted glycosyltransferase
VRVWIDITNSPHVPFFRPLIHLLEEDGHEVGVTARAFAQTEQLLELHGVDATIVGAHGGRSRFGKSRAMVSRLRQLRRWAKPRSFDAALAHGSYDLTLTARGLGIPSTTTFDYEFALAQHEFGARAATRVVVPEAIPAERLRRYGLRPPKLARYPGLKEEYYLADFEPDSAVPAALGVDPRRILVVLRPPPDVALYHRSGNPLFPRTLELLGRRDDVHAVVLPRTDEQRAYVRSLSLPSAIVPERAVDAQSLMAAADLVISAGGTMNREAVALGVPVYTEFAGKLGGVDEQLIREHRLRVLTDPHAIDLKKRDAAHSSPVRREPRELLGILLVESGYA